MNKSLLSAQRSRINRRRLNRILGLSTLYAIGIFLIVLQMRSVFFS